MRVVLLRPPRYLWPFNSETSAFWQPLGLLSLAACARQRLSALEIQVWDCPAEQIGWKSLRQRLAQRQIDVLGIGEETVSAPQAIRAARMVKELWPACIVVAGGVYFAHAVESTLADTCVDAIVLGEGERTLAELLAQIGCRDRWGTIPGLAFSGNDGAIVRTTPRPLIEDLDSLPPPAFDLLRGTYGRASRNHPNLTSIEHSRGCIDQCDFCILWKHMARSANGKLLPTWRTKGPARSFQEVRWLYHRFGRRTFGWVDPTFNVSPEWSDPWAELMLRSELTDARGRARTLHTAWIRADFAVRDQRLGVLDKLVRAGLRQVMIGVERDDEAGLSQLNKHNNGLEVCREAFAIFREKYPSVFTIGTMIYGLPGDSADDLRRLLECQYDLGMGFCFLMPLTPNPGTATAERALAGGYLAEGDLCRYNFHSPVLRTDHLAVGQLESIYRRVLLSGNRKRWSLIMREVLFQRDRRKRRVFWALAGRGVGIAARSILHSILHPKMTHSTLYSRKPSWYDD